MQYEIVDDDSDLIFELPKKETCEGQIYRYTRDAWVGYDGDVNFRDRFRWIKSLSCDGCERCGWLDESLREDMSNIKWGRGVELPDNLKEGQLYRLAITDWSTDWETGVCDDWTIGFEEVKDAQRNNSSVP